MDIPPDIYNGLGIGGCLGFLFVSLARGWIVVGSVYRAAVKVGEDWQDAYFKERDAHAETSKQNGELLRSAGSLQAKLTDAALDNRKGESP